MSKRVEFIKILHLQLRDPLGGDYTLLTNYMDGDIKHILYEGHSSYGTRQSLSLLGMPKGTYLPVDTKYEDETIEEFRERIIEMVREDARMIIVKIVDPKVKFFQP